MSDPARRPVNTRPIVTPNLILETVRNHPVSPVYWVAYSGGLDSAVLLHLAAQTKSCRMDLEIRALHIHHGLHADADAWTAHCQSNCLSLGIPLTVLRVDAGKRPGQSPEEVARRARYQAIESLIGPGDTVLLAQHRDDQAETLLLQLLRGAGLEGLAAMPVRSRLGAGHLLRPLLDCSRAQLAEYANEYGLSWVEDSSNQELIFDRNFLRHEVLPLLCSRWPGLSASLARSARHCAEARDLLNTRTRELLDRVRHPGCDTLSISRLKPLAPADRRLVLRGWIRERGWRVPSTAVLGRIETECLDAGADRSPEVRWREGEVRRYRDALFLLPVVPLRTVGQSLIWQPDLKELALPDGNGILTLRPDDARGIRLEDWRTARVEIRYRRGGEKIRLAGRQGHHDLRKLFQEAGIPPWVRERTPLIYLDERLAAVACFWTAAEFAVSGSGCRGLRIDWAPPAELAFATGH